MNIDQKALENVAAIVPILADLAELMTKQGTQKILVDIKVAEGAGLRQYSFHEIKFAEEANRTTGALELTKQ